MLSDNSDPRLSDNWINSAHVVRAAMLVLRRGNGKKKKEKRNVMRSLEKTIPQLAVEDGQT